MTHDDLSQAVLGPVLLEPDNFTPLSRTPWAGSSMSLRYKRDILKLPAEKKVGESWEFSCDPGMPSSLSELGLSLPELIDQKAREVLSPELASEDGCDGCRPLSSSASQPVPDLWKSTWHTNTRPFIGHWVSAL